MQPWLSLGNWSIPQYKKPDLAAGMAVIDDSWWLLSGAGASVNVNIASLGLLAPSRCSCLIGASLHEKMPMLSVHGQLVCCHLKSNLL